PRHDSRPKSVAGYWVVDLLRGVLIVFRNPVDGAYQDRGEFVTGGIHPLGFLEWRSPFLPE
ncbi:MAG: hypothetical protein SNJ57_19305, partial [Cyanobacteriota bacterium]